MATGLHMVRRAGRGAVFDPATLPGAALWVDTSRSVITKANSVSGTGATLAKSVDTITVSGATGLVASHAGGTITLAGYAAGNNGKFTMLTATTGGCTFLNAAGSAEAGSGTKTWAIEGQCSGVTDLVSGLTLTQPGAITTQLAISTSDNAAGKPVLGQAASGTRWLTLDDTTVAGKLNGPGPSTWFAYFQPLTFGVTWEPLQFRDQPIGTAPASLAQYRMLIAANSGRNLSLTTSAGNVSTFGIGSGLTTFTAGQWYSLAAFYNGAGSVDWYLDGVFVVTATGIARSLVALRSVTIGMFSGASATLSSAGGGKIAGLGAWNANIGTANLAKLHSYFRSWQP